MALLTTWSDANKVESEPLCVTYILLKAAPPVAGQVDYRYCRNMTKRYSFVGMTKATAQACVAAKHDQYKVTVSGGGWEVNPNPPPIYRDKTALKYLANISCRLVGGSMYDVEIVINDSTEAKITSDHQPTAAEIAAAFPSVNTDEDGSTAAGPEDDE